LSSKKEKRRLLGSFIYPAFLIVILWLIKFIEIWFEVDFSYFGIIPLELRGLPGIITAPLIHSDLGHLTSNSIPIFLLTAGLFYYYDKSAFQIFFIAYLITGIWVWLFARGDASHIGASGVVYALASYHFFSGLIRRQHQLMAFAMIVAFLYGSMVWGVVPDFYPKENISWESHLMGAVAGLLLAFFYRDKGPQKEKREFKEHDEEGEERIRQMHGYYPDELEIHYEIKEKNKNKEENKDS